MPGFLSSMWATILKQHMRLAGGWRGILWLLAAKLPLIGNYVGQVVVGPKRPDQAGGLGQADPDPHAGVGHKGAIVPHPGACVSPILLKRHVSDALAKVGEDVRDLSVASLSPLKDRVG